MAITGTKSYNHIKIKNHSIIKIFHISLFTILFQHQQVLDLYNINDCIHDKYILTKVNKY